MARLAPKIFRFTDVDEFRSSVRHLNVAFTPLVRKISAEQIILNLPGCDVNYTKSFPRIIDAQLAADCTAVAFTMDEGVPLRFNGVEPRHPSLIASTPALASVAEAIVAEVEAGHAASGSTAR